MEIRSVPGSSTLFDISFGTGNREVSSIVDDVGPLGWDGTDCTTDKIDNCKQLEEGQQDNKIQERTESVTAAW